MIFSNISIKEARELYPAALRKALDYLAGTDISGLEPGRYPIQGDGIFAVVSDLETRPPELIYPEIHREYIDVQFWPDAGETFGVSPLMGTEDIAEEHPEKDTWYLKPPENESFVTTQAGDYAIFFPWDIHRPGGVKDAPRVIRKCVVKVAVALLSCSE